jgi:hypothetical protein
MIKIPLLVLFLALPLSSFAQKIIGEDADTFTVVSEKPSKSFFSLYPTEEESNRVNTAALKLAAKHGAAKGCKYLARWDRQWTERERRLMWAQGTYNNSGHMLRIESGRVFTTQESIESPIVHIESVAAIFICMRSEPSGKLDARRYATPEELLAL